MTNESFDRSIHLALAAKFSRWVKNKSRRRTKGAWPKHEAEGASGGCTLSGRLYAALCLHRARKRHLESGYVSWNFGFYRKNLWETCPLHNVFYGNDEDAMRKKPENARRSSVRTEVELYLRKLDEDHKVVSFVGPTWRIGDYYVVPVIQIPDDVFTSYPVLDRFVAAERYASSPGLIHTAMYEVLSEAFEALKLPDPGRGASIGKDARETIRAAADAFMRTPAMAISPKEFFMTNLFKSINDLAALLYEGTKGVGRLLLASPDNSMIKYSMRLKPPVSLREARWARKILQMSASDLAIVSDGHAIHGLGTLDPRHDPAQQDVLWIDLPDHYFWTLRIGERALLRVSLWGQ